MTESSREHFQSVIEKFSTALLITRTEQGQIRCRPMSIAEVREDADVWFVTCSDDGKSEEIRFDANVCVAMTDGKRHISLSGVAELDHDRERLKAMWNPHWQTFFPDGPEAENVVLLKVKADQGEFWDVGGMNGVQYLARGAVAYFSGDRPKMDESMHDKVDLA